MEPLTLPTRFTGHFGLVLYYQHHGMLLLRSHDRGRNVAFLRGEGRDPPDRGPSPHDRDDGGSRRIDILFKGVVWMSLPTWFENFTIDQCLIDEVIKRIPPSHLGKDQSRKVYRIEIEGRPQYVIAGAVFSASDDGSYFDPSPLMPEVELNLKFDAE